MIEPDSEKELIQKLKDLGLINSQEPLNSKILHRIYTLGGWCYYGATMELIVAIKERNYSKERHNSSFESLAFVPKAILNNWDFREIFIFLPGTKSVFVLSLSVLY